ncbi:MAG TPA: metal ABC transporter substrate-binding protein, partial [Thermodesulfobacteriota bacterium]|nr:metal ABC transporter substrate-binding protein [Thermodesulfobacteriota bacterium]
CLALLALALAPAHSAGAAAAARPLRVVTTTTDLRALVEAVGGDRVTVASLLAGAQPPHAFEAKPGHVALLRSADLVVRIGLDHDAWLARLLAQAGNPRIRFGAPGHVNTARGIEVLEPVPRTGTPARHVHAFGNPHYWLDPENARPMTRTIADALAAAAPADREGFERRRQAFLERLDAGLARWTRALAPYRGARVVAVHDSFPYLARRFGLVVVGYVEPQPGIPPPPAHLARLVAEMRRRQVRVVLSEAWLPEELPRRVAAEAGATVVKLPTSVDSAPGTGDFVALFDRIVERLVAGFEAAGPPGGR